MGDELLELAGGEGAEFGLSGGPGGDGNLNTMTAEELGIQARVEVQSNSEEAKRSEAILGRALRTWAKDMRERERNRKLRDPPPSSRPRNGVDVVEEPINGSAAKRARANDYDSDSGDSMPDVSDLRRSRRSARASSSTANGSTSRRRRSSRFPADDDPDSPTEPTLEAAQSSIRTARTRYLVEKAKLQHIRAENSRLHSLLQELETEQSAVQRQCTSALEQALVFELGPDVDAIFTPPASPKVASGENLRVAEDEVAV